MTGAMRLLSLSRPVALVLVMGIYLANTDRVLPFMALLTISAGFFIASSEPPQSLTPGLGLKAMAERAHALGGELVVAPRSSDCAIVPRLPSGRCGMAWGDAPPMTFVMPPSAKDMRTGTCAGPLRLLEWGRESSAGGMPHDGDEGAHAPGAQPGEALRVQHRRERCQL